MTGDADKDFVAMMIPHLQGTIDMAKVELKYGKDLGLKKLARDIIDAQEKELHEGPGGEAVEVGKDYRRTAWVKSAGSGPRPARTGAGVCACAPTGSGRTAG